MDTCGFIILDGFVVPGRFLFGQGITSRGGVRASKSTERPFMFQKVPEIGTFLKLLSCSDTDIFF